ncbi:MAG: SMC-Scp complex subunit ScpB, partial [Parcubacteria group bacterium]|nr:SMC-Scp complex subunit ScpB [Parcubacteria group bacterium]
DLGQELEGANRGIRLLRSGNEFILGSTPEAGPFVEKLFREEFGEELTSASLETLAIIAYRGPISRAEIDYIRGVNSSYILRSLLIRGLISRSQDASRPQIFLYRPSFDLLKLLGATSQKDLPDYDILSKKLEELNKTESDGSSTNG